MGLWSLWAGIAYLRNPRSDIASDSDWVSEDQVARYALIDEEITSRFASEEAATERTGESLQMQSAPITVDQESKHDDAKSITITSTSTVTSVENIQTQPLLEQIDVDLDGTSFLIRVGSYCMSLPLTPDIWDSTKPDLLEFAICATPGADAIELEYAGRSNVTGLLEDEYILYEGRARCSPENILALKATWLSWSDAAVQLAASAEPSPDQIEEVQAHMAHLSRKQNEAIQLNISKSSNRINE